LKNWKKIKFKWSNKKWNLKFKKKTFTLFLLIECNSKDYLQKKGGEGEPSRETQVRSNNKQIGSNHEGEQQARRE
jgi:hypothetical protein